ncbi:DUF3108 domain-containing protein [Xylophilus sp. GOD-11R]|uniref:DUF3108 domain-containing protein n=1 Tax=Xylophilus sp. GOD-11R TaxID=3089814 RepID=UPI00298C01AD|nr:DUF3108 domain-containing protein [Xylophilus sp. GOD-11R]WPB56732.1 DUF3108 domain-containing protein [Xylophilus sp. GOD-11R]
MRHAASAPPVKPIRLSRAMLAVLAIVVLAAHLTILGWLPLGSTNGQALDEKTLHLVTRVVPPPPPPPPARKPRPRPTAQPESPSQPVATPSAVSDDAAAPDSGANDGTAPASDGTAPEQTTAEATPPPEPTPPVSATPPPPIGLPASVRLRYEMNGEAKGLVYHANADLLWQQDGARYSTRMEVSAFLIGSRIQTSEGTIGPAGLEPERFTDKGKREQATHFDRAAGRIVFSSNAPQMPLPPGAQDRLSVFLQLSSQMAGDPGRYPKGTTITIPTAGSNDLGEWTFVVGDEEALQLPIGAQQAIRLERSPRKAYDTRVEVWIAPALGYLPVRMRITQQNGDFIEQRLDSAERP